MSSTTHIDSKELKRPDEFVRVGREFFTKMSQRRSAWIPIVAVLAAIALAYWGYGLWKESKDNQAWEGFYKASRAIAAEQPNQWEEVAKKFPGTQAGFFAMVSLADHFFDIAKKEAMQNPAQSPAAGAAALEWYRKALGFSALVPLEKQLLLINQGESLELQRKWDEALSSYRSAADIQAEGKALALISTARVYELKNEVSKATEQYEKVSTDYGNTEYGRVAKNALRRMKSPLFRGAQS